MRDVLHLKGSILIKIIMNVIRRKCLPLFLSKMWIHLLIFLMFMSSWSWAQECHYEYTVWNSQQRRSTRSIKVSKNRSALTKEEKGSHQCTPCVEDQQTITLRNHIELTVCKYVALDIQKTLNQAIEEGFIIESIVGYRPSKSRGPLDMLGNRTQFSQHAYGLAIDINEAHNGLYANCQLWKESCRLLKGGAYEKKHSLSIQPDGVLVQRMRAIKWLWGGERPDSLKDFMHFSPDGL